MIRKKSSTSEHFIDFHNVHPTKQSQVKKGYDAQAPRKQQPKVYTYAPYKQDKAVFPKSIQKDRESVFDLIRNQSSLGSIGISPATTESSKSSLGGRMTKKLRRKHVRRMQRASDTNEIYPPSKAYGEVNEEMKSPTKVRPLSGGPSPDKNKLRV